MRDKDKTRIKSIEEGRADFAYKCVKQVINLNSFEFKGREIYPNYLKKLSKDDNKSHMKTMKEYRAYTKKIPMLIKVNGLGATLAFMKSKGKTYNIVYDQITEWLKADGKKLIEIENDLVESIISLNSSNYRTVTNEVLAFFKLASQICRRPYRGRC